MLNATRLTSGLVVLLALAACGTPAPISPQAVIQPAHPDAVVADLGEANGRTLAITLVEPQDAAYTTLTVIHRWVVNDIIDYVVVLRDRDDVSQESKSTVIVPRKGAPPKTQAVFTNLKQGLYYQASVTARGNKGGDILLDKVSLNTPAAIANFDFTDPQDVEDTPATENVKIVFDAVDFNGKGTVNLIPPDEGVYTNPSLPEVGSTN